MTGAAQFQAIQLLAGNSHDGFLPADAVSQPLELFLPGLVIAHGAGSVQFPLTEARIYGYTDNTET